MKILNEGAAVLKDKVGVDIKYYPNGVQGDERAVVRKMRLGQLDGAALTSVGLSMIVPSIRVLELPRMFRSAKQMRCVRAWMWGRFRRRFKRKGYVLGEPGEVGAIYFYSQHAIKSLGDLKNHKVWLWSEDRLVRRMFKKLNINGKPMGVPRVLPALQQGKINAFYGSPTAAVALQWYTKARYVTSMPMSYAIGASVIRKSVYDKLSKDQKKLQKSITKTFGSKMRRTIRRQEAKSRRAYAGRIKTVTTPPAMVKNFDTAAHQVWDDLVGNLYSKSDLAAVKKYRDTKCAKY
jgi:TRAP-type C4-dicarboxylate transport system substrate-binding protein